MCLPVKPFRIEREWKHAGLSCAVVLAREAQHRCSYVRVPPTHPAHGKSYDNLDVQVHGGLTFSEIEPCKEHEDGQGYWFGFDCAHAGDAMYDPTATPETVSAETVLSLKIHSEIARKYPLRQTEHYWTQLEVEAETERLADQLAVMERVA